MSVVLTLAGIGAGAPDAGAATCNYQGVSGGDWHAGVGAWSCGKIPDNGDDVILDGADNVAVSSLNEAAASLTSATGTTLAIASGKSLAVGGAWNVTGGTLNGSGGVSVGGAFSKTTAGELDVQLDATLTLNGASSISGGFMCLGVFQTGDGFMEVNATFSILTGADAAPLRNCGNSGTVHINGPNGRLLKDSPGETTISRAIDNDDTVEIAQGDLAVSGGNGSSQTGDWTVPTGSTLTFSGPANNIDGSITGTGTAITKFTGGTTTIRNGATYSMPATEITGGTFDLTGTGTATTGSLLLNGGSRGGNRTTFTTGSLDARTGNLNGGTTTVTGTFTKTTAGTMNVQLDATLTLNGASSISGGFMCLGVFQTGDGTLNVGGTLTLASGSDSTPIRNCGNTSTLSILSPDGRLELSGATSKSISSSTTNAGTVAIASGQTLAFTATYGQTGGATNIASGGTFNGSPTASGGTLALDGALSGNIGLTAGAVLGGGGAITGNVTNTSGNVRPGSSPGFLTINGDFTQAGGGTLTIDVNGTGQGTTFDLLSVNGNASLAGTLAIVQGVGFDPALTDTFQFLTASGTRTGTFVPVTGGTLPSAKSYVAQYDGAGYVAPPKGARLAVLPPPPPMNQTLPSITPPSALVGQTLTCNPGTWANSPTSFAFEWKRDGATIAGATQNTYVIQNADATHALTCRVTATNSGGSAAADSSNSVTPPAVPPVAVKPVITGTPALAQVLTCVPGNWGGAPAPVLSFQWLFDDKEIPGETATSLVVAAADLTHRLTCRVTGANAGGQASATSDPVTPPAIPPANTVPPSITGQPVLDQTLTCSLGTFTGTPPPVLTIEWLRDGIPIAGATQATYKLAAEDVGHDITCRVKATNDGGSVTQTSRPVTVSQTEKALDQIATLLGLPPAKKCLSKRNFLIRVKNPPGATVKKAIVEVNGKRVKVKKSGGRFTATVDLRGLTKGSFKIRITVTTTAGAKLVGQRKYKTCAKKTKSKRKVKL